MLDTTDLTSYYPGYDDYCKIDQKEDTSMELEDIYYDDFMIRGGVNIMHKEIIDLTKTELTSGEIANLSDYVWKNDKLIPVEEGK